jgi:uncharacterized damage-inducible protein DinB
MSNMPQLSELLLPELEFELGRARRILQALPDGHLDFKPHDKSMTLAKLAGHTAELPGFVSIILTIPSLDTAVPGNPRKPVIMETVAQLVEVFDANAERAVAALKATSNDTFVETWSLSRGPMAIYSGNRYGAYRAFGINHIIHHRAQLGTYIRLLNCTLPGTYGPSADGM